MITTRNRTPQLRGGETPLITSQNNSKTTKRVRKFITILTAFLLFMTTGIEQVNAQGLGLNNPTPDPSAILDLTATNRGLLIPRMTTTQIGLIGTPATGLLVFDTDIGEFYFYNGTGWVPITDDGDWTNSGNYWTNLTDSFGIGTATPGAKLDVAGHIWQTGTGNSVFLGEGAGANDDLTTNANVFVGYLAGNSATTGTSNTYIGTRAGESNTSFYNTMVGYQAGQNSTGIRNLFFGYLAGSSNTGANNTYLGYGAGSASGSGGSNVFIGYQAGQAETGSNKLYIANSSSSPPLIYGDFSTDRIGLGTVTPDTTLHIVGSIKMVDGLQAAGNILTSDASGLASWQTPADDGDWTVSGNYVSNSADSIAIGHSAPIVTLDVRDTYEPPATSGNANGATFIGSTTNAVGLSIGTANSGSGASTWMQSWFNNNAATTRQLVLNPSGGNVGIGLADPAQALDVAGTVEMTGFKLTTAPTAGYLLTSDASGVGTWQTPANDDDWTVSGNYVYNSTDSIGVGTATPSNPLTVSGNADFTDSVGIGTATPDAELEVVGILSLQKGTANVVVGKTAGTSLSTGTSNTFLGYGAGSSTSSNTNNTFIGYNAGLNATTSHSIAIGYNAGYQTTGFRNIFLGYQTGYSNTTGTDNTYLGYLSGYTNSTGSGNVYIGYSAGRLATGSNELFIDNTNTSTPLIYGDFSTDRLGFGTNTPANKLDVEGAIAVGATYSGTSAAPTDGAIIEGDVGIGDASPDGKLEVRQTGTADIFNLYDNTTNVLSVLDGGDLMVDATTTFYVDASANEVGIGNATPDGKLEVRQGGTADIFNLYDNTTNVFTVIDGGKVGIGATTPSSLLHLKLSGTGIGDALRFETSLATSEDWYMYMNSTDDLVFRNDGSDYVTFEKNTGSVGIGASSPSYPLHVVGTGTSYVAGFDKNNASGSNLIRFMRQGSFVGNITESSGTVSYNPFTGSHYGMSDEKMEKGILVTMTGRNKTINNLENGEPIYGVAISTQPNDPKILGAYLDLVEDEDLQDKNEQKVMAIMAVGNGLMWIVDNGENIEIGDYIISSSVPGHAMKDKGEFAISHIIARAAEPIDWSGETQTINGVKHKKISMFFESFTIEHSGGIKNELELLKKENDNLKADIEEIQQYLEIKAELDQE